MTTIRKTAAIAALLLAAGIARAAPPKTITYSGFLLDGTGAPVGATSTLTFRLYDAASGGNMVYQEAVTVLPSVSDGYFSATIGLVQLLPDAVFNAPLFLAVRFGAEAEMSPRIPLSSVPSAFSAVSVDWTGIQGRPSSACSGGTPYVTGIDPNGVAICAAAPAGAAGCATGQVQKWNGTAWTCQNDANTVYTANAPLSISGGNVITIATASATVTGALSSADWVTFNGKLSSVAVAAPLTGDGATTPISMPQAGAAASGFLSSADWATFNNKLGSVAVSAPLTGNGQGGTPITLAAANGTTNGYLTSTDWTVFSNKVSSVSAATNGGLVVSGTTTPAISLITSCGNNAVLRWNAGASTWECSTALTGTVAVSGPLLGDGTAGNPIALSAASLASPGYLTSTAFSAFSNKLDNVVAAWPLTGLGVTGTPLGLGNGGVTFTHWNQNGCTANQLPRWNGTAWTCSMPIDDAGCAVGQVLKWTGTAFTCQADIDTNNTYTNGSGLSLTGSTFSIATGGVTNAMLAGAISLNKLAISGCVDGYAPVLQGTSFACLPVVSTFGVSAPLVNLGTAANPTIGMLPASNVDSGYLTTTQYGVLNSALQSVSTRGSGMLGNGTSGSPLGLIDCAAGAQGLALMWDGSTWSCAVAVRSVAAPPGSGITVTPGAWLSDLSLGLENLGATGTYGAVNVDAYGRVTGGAPFTTLGEYGILDAVRLQTPATVYQTGDLAVDNGFVQFNLWVGGTISGNLSGNATTATTASSVTAGAITPASLALSGAAPTAGQVPTSNGGAAFQWVTPVTGVAARAGGGMTVTGAAPTPQVGLTTACTANQGLKWNGSAWVCVGVPTWVAQNAWTAGFKLLDIPTLGYVQTTGTAGQLQLVSYAANTHTIFYNLAIAGGAEESGQMTAATGSRTFTTTATGLYDSIRLVIGDWSNGTAGFATFTGARMGGYVQGIVTVAP